MNAEKPSRFQTSLVATLVFSLATSLVINFFPFGENVVVNLAVGMILWLLLATIAGLTVNNKSVTYYVSVIVAISLSSKWLVPFRFPSIADSLLYPLSYLGFGYAVGVISEPIQNQIQNFIRGEKQISLRLTPKGILKGSLVLICVVFLSFIVIYSETVSAYFDQHPWVVALLGIIATAISSFYGGRQYGKRKKTEK